MKIFHLRSLFKLFVRTIFLDASVVDSKLLSPKKCIKLASSKRYLKWLTIMWVCFLVLDVRRQKEGVIWSSYPPGD